MREGKLGTTETTEDDEIDLIQSALGNQTISKGERDLFQALLQENTNLCLEIFLSEKSDKPWLDIKNILLDDDNNLKKDKLQTIRSSILQNLSLQTSVSDRHSKVMPSSEYIADSMSERNSSDGFDSSYSSAFERPHDSSASETITKTEKAATRQSHRITDKPIRGELITYAKGTMGGFGLTTLNSRGKRDGNLYISANSVITRPNKVTGNLGQEAGDHVISFSLFTKYVESLVKGKEVYDAIEALRIKVASFHEPTDVERTQDSYQAIIEKTKLFERSYNPYDQIEAFEFLKSEFIPHLIATWNQQDLTAFKSHKTATERGIEGESIKRALKGDHSTSVDYLGDEEIDRFIAIVDYKPIAPGEDVQPNSIRTALGTGERNNDVNTLSRVVGRVIETYSSIYDIDAQNYAQITEAMVEKMLEQHGWLDHYCTHPEELRVAIGSSSRATRAQRDAIEHELKTRIIESVKYNNPHLADTLSISGSSKRSIENDSVDSPSSNSEFTKRMKRAQQSVAPAQKRKSQDAMGDDHNNKKRNKGTQSSFEAVPLVQAVATRSIGRKNKGKNVRRR